MNFRTQIPLKKQNNRRIDYNSKILLLGSCFSENIGNKFNYFKFKTTINPFGILFHPKAIECFLNRVIHQDFYAENDLIFNNEQFHCFDAHSSFSKTDKNFLLEELNSILEASLKQLSEVSHLFITLGTAWVYKHKKQNKIVANCHKVAQKEFDKNILSVSEILASLDNIEDSIKSINPGVKIIYTVSPVRHLKDGFIENQQSKSFLMSAIHQHTLKTNNVYFPSYEIMMDDLRDYRFYKSDMIHPNQVAIDYIWESFKSVWFCDSTLPVLKKVEKIQKGTLHKPFNKESIEYQKFLQNLNLQKQELRNQYPHIKF